MIDDDSKVSEGLNAIPNESRVLDDPQVFQKESQLDVRTLIIPKSTVMPTSSMVLFTLRRVLGLLVEESYHFLLMTLLFFGLFGALKLTAQVKRAGMLFYSFGD